MLCFCWGVTHTEAISETGQRIKKPANPGQYKRLPNHVLQSDGTIHYYTQPLHVADEMEELCQWIHTHIETQHPLLTAAAAHYNMVRIHPFDDGNGCGARLLMNLILLKKGYPPAIVKTEERRSYLETLRQADNGDLAPVLRFIARSLISTQEMILDELNRNE